LQQITQSERLRKVN